MWDRVKYRAKVLRALKPFAYGAKRFFLLSFAMTVLITLLSFVTPRFYRIFIDDVILSGRFSAMPLVAAGYLGVFLLTCLAGYCKRYATNRVSNRTLFRMKHKVWRGYFRMPFPELEQQSIGDMRLCMDQDMLKLRPFAQEQTIDYALSCVTYVAAAVLLFTIEWRLALFSMSVIPATFLVDRVLAKGEAKCAEQFREITSETNVSVSDSIRCWREVKALGVQRREKKIFAGFIRRRAGVITYAINYQVARLMVIPKIKDEFLMQFLLYFFGGLLILGRQLTIGSLLLFSQYYALLSAAVKKVSDCDSELLIGSPHIDRVLEELGKEWTGTDKGEPIQSVTGIEIAGLTFAYPRSQKPVLSGFDLSLSPGDRLAITGESGCGKTTLLKLMSGILAPDKGEILYSGKRLERISLPSLHRKIGFIMQDSSLFNDSIRENLLYGKRSATQAELEDACRKAHILDFVEGLPDGFGTVIGERGVKLSGGQRQRILLARTLLRDVDVYFFDEATSALDQYAENLIYDAIRAVDPDKIIIVVSHRPSSLQLCNRHVAMGG